MAISRRHFLKGLAASSAAALIGQSLLVRTAQAAVSAEGSWKMAGSHWGAFKALVKGGVVSEVKAFELDKHPTDMLNGIKGLIYNPSRIRYPMARLDWLKNRENSDRTQRGDNRFVRLTWDEALDLFHEELERTQTQYGPGHCMPAPPAGARPASFTAAATTCSGRSTCTVTSSARWATTPPVPAR